MRVARHKDTRAQECEASHKTFGQGQNLAPDSVSASDPAQRLFPPPHCVATTVRIVSGTSATRAAFTTRHPSAFRTPSSRGRGHLRAVDAAEGTARTGRDLTTSASTWARQARRGATPTPVRGAKSRAHDKARSAAAHAARTARCAPITAAARMRTGCTERTAAAALSVVCRTRVASAARCFAATLNRFGRAAGARTPLRAARAPAHTRKRCHLLQKPIADCTAGESCVACTRAKAASRAAISCPRCCRSASSSPEAPGSIRPKRRAYGLQTAPCSRASGGSRCR